MRILDKQFKPYLSELQIAEAVKRLAAEMNKDLGEAFPLFIVVLNGSFMFASDLLKEISVNCQISFVKLASYEGMGSSGNVKELIGLNEEVKGRTVIILEDIIDTGKTIEQLIQVLKTKEVKDIKVASLLVKREIYKGKTPINYVGISIANDFVIGYGMDYNGAGRNLKEIYITE